MWILIFNTEINVSDLGLIIGMRCRKGIIEIRIIRVLIPMGYREVATKIKQGYSPGKSGAGTLGVANLAAVILSFHKVVPFSISL